MTARLSHGRISIGGVHVLAWMTFMIPSTLYIKYMIFALIFMPCSKEI